MRSISIMPSDELPPTEGRGRNIFIICWEEW